MCLLRVLPALLTLTLADGLHHPAHAGAWTPERGAVYARMALNRYVTHEEFDGNGEEQKATLNGEFEDRNVSLYFEYGVIDRLAVVVGASAKELRSENIVRVIESRGIADLDLAVRARLFAGRSGVASLQLLTKVPTGYETDVPLPLGNGEVEWEARLLYGRSLSPLLPGYVGIETGYRLRPGQFADLFRYQLEAGADLAGGFYARTKLDGTRGRREATTLDSSGNPTVRATYDLAVLDTVAGRRFGPHLALEAGWSPALYGRTTTSGTTWSLAVSYAGRLHGSQAGNP